MRRDRTLWMDSCTDGPARTTVVKMPFPIDQPWRVWCPCRPGTSLARVDNHWNAMSYADWHARGHCPRRELTVAGHPPWSEWGDPAAWDRARQ